MVYLFLGDFWRLIILYDFFFGGYFDLVEGNYNLLFVVIRLIDGVIIVNFILDFYLVRGNILILNYFLFI